VTLRFKDGHCVFLVDERCSVHEVKPVQCRTFPFWEELLETPETYRAQVLDFCPGSGEGERVPAAEIARQVTETEAAFERGEA
jgi:Fe-S-cluster containining protein